MTMPRLLRCLLALILAGTAVLTSAHAQNAPVQNPQNTLQQVNPPQQGVAQPLITAGLRTDDQDLSGLQVVKSYPVPQTLTFSTDQNAFWTDNAFLTKHNLVSSFGYNGRERVTYIPYSTRDWTPSISFEQQIVRYDHSNILDFDGQTVQLGSHYNIVKDGSWSWDASYSLMRLYTSRLNAGEFYKESFLDDTINYIKPLTSDGSLFFLGSYEIGWRLTDPGQYERIDNAFLASLIYLPDPKVRIQAYLRPAIYDYTCDQEVDLDTGEVINRSRTDYNVSTGLSLAYSPIKQISLSASLNWTSNFSDVGFREYNAITPTLGVSGAIGFW